MTTAEQGRAAISLGFKIDVWSVLCVIAACWMAWNGEWLPAGIFAGAAKL